MLTVSAQLKQPHAAAKKGTFSCSLPAQCMHASGARHGTVRADARKRPCMVIHALASITRRTFPPR